MIKAISIRSFRSLERVELEKCAPLNVLIGKNNSGKSNILAAIDIALDHLRTGRIAADWKTRGRAADEFTNRVFDEPLQIGLELELSETLVSEMTSEIHGLEVAIAGLAGNRTLSVIVAGSMSGNGAFRYVQGMALGTIIDQGQRLSIDGIRLYSVSDEAAKELIQLERTATKQREEISALEQILSEGPSFEPSVGQIPYVLRRVSENLRPETVRMLESVFRNPSGDAMEKILDIKRQAELAASVTETKETKATTQAFGGSVNRTPTYVLSLLKGLGEINVVYFRETRRPVGAEEASQLLRLKTTRGGPEQLSAFQRTVKALLGVSVDAFEADPSQLMRLPSSRRRSLAEMDIDQFLVEANGAGIREALRILLDLELGRSTVALIEEPEVHLHPGLEKIIHSYLVQKSAAVQIFLATHSTQFLDVSSKQNVFIVSRADSHTTVRKAVTEDDMLTVPTEIGLRPSTVFMFDRLVFVEGPSDESIFREFSKALDVDLASQNVGFVRMGGATNFAHFAADATLGLLSRRQIPMWFIVDRDERDDVEIKRMIGRLGDRAQLVVLN